MSLKKKDKLVINQLVKFNVNYTNKKYLICNHFLVFLVEYKRK